MLAVKHIAFMEIYTSIGMIIAADGVDAGWKFTILIMFSYAISVSAIMCPLCFWTNQSSSWTIYYTSIMDENIFEDHFFLAPGEYRVYINSPSGEVTYCGYYNDEFWLEYAIRCWEHGSKDYVYEEAKKPAFRQLLAADQEYFLSLFQTAGYDIPSLKYDQ